VILRHEFLRSDLRADTHFAIVGGTRIDSDIASRLDVEDVIYPILTAVWTSKAAGRLRDLPYGEAGGMVIPGSLFKAPDEVRFLSKTCLGSLRKRPGGFQSSIGTAERRIPNSI
jgi:hypothetical protein